MWCLLPWKTGDTLHALADQFNKTLQVNHIATITKVIPMADVGINSMPLFYDLERSMNLLEGGEFSNNCPHFPGIGVKINLIPPLFLPSIFISHVSKGIQYHKT